MNTHQVLVPEQIEPDQTRGCILLVEIACILLTMKTVSDIENLRNTGKHKENLKRQTNLKSHPRSVLL